MLGVALEHITIFVCALDNILSSVLALLTLAQIVGGLPIAGVVFDRADT